MLEPVGTDSVEHCNCELMTIEVNIATLTFEFDGLFLSAHSG